jgi:16S rRNA (guanine527-N7)-methyltransferase
MIMSELWTLLAQRASIQLDEQQRVLLHRYLDLLLDANTRMNLTRITDRAQAELNHIADSLTILPFIPEAKPTPSGVGLRICDVGSGGGVPGIPLAIMRPDCHFTLVESTKKKAAFLRDAVQQLNLPNVTITDQRAEDLAHSDQRETFDVVIARAVATMDWLVEWCMPLVKKGGTFLAMKGPKVETELPDAKKALNVTASGDPILHPIDLLGTDHRLVIEIPKLGKSDPRYPRPATQAKGKPIR